MSRAALYDIVRIFEARMEAISEEYIRVMGRHLREIGTVGPADMNRLAQLERAGKNAADLRRRIAKEARMSLKDVDALLAAAARENAAYAARMTGGGTGINLAKNPRLLRILRAQASITRQSMLNLSQTTVETGKYRNAISVAVQAVQTGATDYASAIRRALRDAAGVELRYPSGITRRLDTAVRQNVLDGVRSLNQAMMQEIGDQLGADGVEISAHMLCAEDHLPYQGRQYTLKAFEAIQGSLARPFGMWNCKHTMHPIFLGISQPAYSEEDLKKYEAFSTEPVEIDGRTLTRYEWSQRQRAIETAVRREKDAAIAFEASGDRIGQREAQARIQALTQHYNRITGEAGLEPEYGRMYARGYRNVKRESGLTAEVNNGTLASDSTDIFYPITRESIESVPKFTEFASDEVNEAVHKACVELLSDLSGMQEGTEGIISLPISKAAEYNRGILDMTKYKRIGEPGEGVVQILKQNEPYLVIHNHPSNSTFSYNDIELFANEGSIVGIIAIGNNGKNTYTLFKTERHDFMGFAKYRLKRKYGFVKFSSEEAFLKGISDYGIRYTSRYG